MADEVPCRLCGVPTRMLNTELCDHCWNALNILEFIKSNKGTDVFDAIVDEIRNGEPE